MKKKITFSRFTVLTFSIVSILIICLGYTLSIHFTYREQSEIDITYRDKKLQEALLENDLLQQKLEEAVLGSGEHEESISTLKKELEDLRKTLESSQEEHELLILKGLVRVKDIDASIVTDLRYATEDNFTGRKVYPDNSQAILRLETALKLKKANERFEKDGYRIKIWDAYRPRSVQEIFWALVPDPRYVADPAKGSVHNRGASVDITLVDLEGRELKMPTEYDDFSEKASRTYTGTHEEALSNMRYLTEIMEESGFKGLPSEWWHFDDEDSGYPLIEVSFDEFQ